MATQDKDALLSSEERYELEKIKRRCSGGTQVTGKHRSSGLAADSVASDSDYFNDPKFSHVLERKIP